MLALAWIIASCAALPLSQLAPRDGAHEPDQTAIDVRVSVAGVSVVSAEAGELWPFHGFERDQGVRVGLLVRPVQRKIIDIQHAESKLTLTDDAARDLKAKIAADFGTGVRIAEDRTAGVVQLAVNSIPSPNAKQLRVKGRLNVSLSESTATASVKDVAIRKGASVHAGPVELRVSQVTTENEEDWPLAIEFSSPNSPTRISSIRFLNATNNTIESQQIGAGYEDSGGTRTYSIRYQVRRKIDAATIEVTYWDPVTEARVPIDIEFGVGLAVPAEPDTKNGR